jgi:hypothetical protein
MKKILFLVTFIIFSCSKDDSSDSATQTTQDATDSWGAWSDWSPSFSDQTSDFSQTRNRSVVVKGNADSTPPSGESSETRNVTVSLSSSSNETNERVTNIDINNDDDAVDYFANVTKTYTASIGGDFSVESVEITKDQPLNILTYNYGVWSTNNEGTIIPSNVTADPGTEFEQSVSVDANMAYEVLDETVNYYTAESVNSCYTLEEVDLPNGVSIEVIKLNLDEYESDVYGLEPGDYLEQEDINSLAELGVYSLGQYTIMEIIDYSEVSALYVGSAIYAEFSDGSQYVFFSLGYTMVYYGLLDTSEFICSSSSGRSFKDVKSFKERNGIDLNKGNNSFKKFLENKKNKTLNGADFKKTDIRAFLESEKINYLNKNYKN